MVKRLVLVSALAMVSASCSDESSRLPEGGQVSLDAATENDGRADMPDGVVADMPDIPDANADVMSDIESESDTPSAVVDFSSAALTYRPLGWSAGAMRVSEGNYALTAAVVSAPRVRLDELQGTGYAWTVGELFAK